MKELVYADNSATTMILNLTLDKSLMISDLKNCNESSAARFSESNFVSEWMAHIFSNCYDCLMLQTFIEYANVYGVFYGLMLCHVLFNE